MSTQRLRASDAEREQVAHVLREAMSEGRLTLEEGEERLTKVYATTYRDELTPLVADLPGGGWHALRDTPQVKAEARRHARGHVGSIVFVAAVLVGIWVLSGAAGFFWPLIPLVFLGFCLLRNLRWQRYGARRPGSPWAAATAAPPWTRR